MVSRSMLPQLVGQRLFVYGNSIDRHLNPAFGIWRPSMESTIRCQSPTNTIFSLLWLAVFRSVPNCIGSHMCSRRDLYRPVQPRQPAFELINFSFARFGLHSTRLGNLQDPSASMGRNRRQQLIWRRITGQ